MFQTGLDLLRPAARPPASAMRMVASGGDTLYVKLPTRWGTALAIRFQRNLGGAGAFDLGSPWPVWRRTGAFEIASVTADPATPLFTYASDPGSFDYAFTESSSAKWGGSYHGGETILSETWRADSMAFDPTVGEKLAGRFQLTRTSTITWAAGKTMDVSYTLSIESDGSLVETASFSSTAAFSSASHVGMEILARHFDELRLASGVTDVETIANYDLAAGDEQDVTFRSLSTGHTVRTRGNIADMPGYLKTYVASQSTRFKHYPQLASTVGGPFGTRGYQRRVTYGKAAPNRFSYNAARDGLTGTTRAGETAPVIDTAADPDSLLFDRSSTATAWIDRYWMLGNLEQGNWRINLNYTKVGTGSIGTSLAVTKATDGSLLTPTPLVNTGFTNVTDHYDFAISDTNLDPVTMHIRMATVAASTDRLRPTAFNLERI